MLDRDEDAALAEIEAALRRDDPAFVALLEQLERDPAAETDPGPYAAPHPATHRSSPVPLVIFDDAPVLPARRRWLRLASIALAVALALTATLAVTVAWGPDAGGLVGVITIMAATIYGYQVLRGCPGRRR
ncbi:MAG: DUF3040 domain-containing protein [Acidimicrobiia bacterium]